MLIEIPEFKDYFINEIGQIYSKKSNKWLKDFINTSGYSCYKLQKNGHQYNLLTHRLLAYIFKNLPDLYSELEVDHDDQIRSNNDLTNLIVRSKTDHLLKTLVARGHSNLQDLACPTCGGSISKNAIKCKNCILKDRPVISVEDITYWVKNYSWVRASKELGLSDTGLRKRYFNLTGKDPKLLKHSV